MAKRLKTVVRNLGAKPWFAKIGKRIMPPLDRAVHKLSRGKVQLSGGILPTLILKHTGRRSGKAYATPLAYLPDGDNYIIVGSNWGQEHHPAWTHNLLADPHVTVETKGRAVEVTAAVIEGEDREATWQRLLEIWPAYDTYVERAGDRVIRLFRLSPRG